MIRGTFAFVALGLVFLVGDVVQRTIIFGLVTLFKGKKARILAIWQRSVARTVLGLLRVVGGARFKNPPRLPGEGGVLVLMNHQSIFDIPLVISAFDGHFPRIVTRARYAKGKPLVSGMTRLYQYPLVGSGATIQEDLARLQETGRNSPGPIVIFPEGHRTRDGEIRPFKKGGLRALLGGRVWRVYLLVVDGFWRCSKLKDFILAARDIRGSIRLAGPITSPGDEEEIEGFIDDVRNRMVAMLAESREEAGVS